MWPAGLHACDPTVVLCEVDVTDSGKIGLRRTTEGHGTARTKALLVAEATEPHLLADDPFIDADIAFTRVSGLAAAQGVFAQLQPDLVFLPITVDGQSARQFLDQIFAAPVQPVVVVVASNDQINAAAEAMRLGAFDCLFRPFSEKRLAKTIAAATAALPVRSLLGSTSGTNGASSTSAPIAEGDAPPGAPPYDEAPIFVSIEMQAVLARVDAVARSEAPVFLTGEPGTGKALIASVLHARSNRADGPLVTVDCATLSTFNFAEEMAGRDGAIARASGGTLHLDEIGALDPALQPRLLALIDEALSPGHEDGSRPRLVASTRHDPVALLRNGQLRPELYYRLHVTPIALPPLRARQGDIQLIAEAKLATFARREGRGFTSLRADTLKRLEAYEWPGNVRELINAIWAVVALHDGTEVTPDMLPLTVVTGPGTETTSGSLGLDNLIGLTLDEIEERVIDATIRSQGGSIPRAARVLGVSPSTIYRKREAWARRGER